MFVPVTIDIQDVADEFYLSKKEVKDLQIFVLDTVVDEYMRKWDNKVDTELHQTRNEYRKGMFVENPDEFSVIVGLTPRQSKLSMMLEEGASSFDIKEGMSKSSKKKTNKQNKWYIRIPFQWATTQAVGEFMVATNKIPKPIMDLVKTQREGLKLNQIPEQFQGKGKNVTSGYEHKNNIFEGMIRYEVGSGSEKRGRYMTFRTISENSDNGAFIHPGLKKMDLMGKAFDELQIDRVVDKAVDDFLSERTK